MKSATLRAAVPTDADDVAAVLLASRKTLLPFAPLAPTDDEVRAWVREVLLPSEAVTVAIVDDRIIGVLSVAQQQGASWITQLYLLPSHVAQGIGSGLLAHVISTATLPIRVYTFQQNAGARRFYERNGFRPIEFTDGRSNEEQCPDVLYERAAPALVR